MDRDFATPLSLQCGESVSLPLVVGSVILRFQKRLKCGAMLRDFVMRYDLVMIMDEDFAIFMLFFHGDSVTSVLALKCSRGAIML